MGRKQVKDRGSQIVEFALSLPILVFFIFGIFDFSGALSLKHKLTNGAREAARVAAADPAVDLTDSSTGVPVSISDAYQALDNYLISENINDCKLSAGTLQNASGSLIWTATANANCPGGASPGLQLTINRGCINQQSVTVEGAAASATLNLASTCVTLSYPYVWRFTGVSGLFGKNFIPPTSITTTAMAFNEN